MQGCSISSVLKIKTLQSCNNPLKFTGNFILLLSLNEKKISMLLKFRIEALFAVISLGPSSQWFMLCPCNIVGVSPAWTNQGLGAWPFQRPTCSSTSTSLPTSRRPAWRQSFPPLQVGCGRPVWAGGASWPRGSSLHSQAWSQGARCRSVAGGKMSSLSFRCLSAGVVHPALATNHWNFDGRFG